MKSLRYKFVCCLLALGGIVLLGGALYGFGSLYQAYSSYEHTVGQIRKTRTERTYRHRKMRFKHEMELGYPTADYGELRVSKEYYRPFRREGDELTVLYHPDRPRDIRLPGEECWIWSAMLVCGLVCAGGAWAMLRPDRRKERE